MRRGLFLSFLAGFLLTLAFPRWNLWLLAWVGLVPLFSALEGARNRKIAFLYSFTAGFVFFFLSISWLRHVSVFGWLFVATMEAAYWGIFGVLFVIARKPGGRAKQSLRSDFLLAASWVALELIRSEVPVWGFGWNLLGASQAPALWIAQLAGAGGVYAVSFLVFLGNGVIDSLLHNGVKKEFRRTVFFGLLLMTSALFGWSRIESFRPLSFFRISVLQGNIPQQLKWETAYRQEILKVYLNLTELASYDSPELMIWPEAAFPGFFNRDLLAEQVQALTRRIQIPLLVGSPHQGDDRFYNSAYLLDPSGKITDRYDKIHLVPFGEYVPWKPILGFLEPYAYALGVSDFSAGREFRVFKLGGPGPRFSVLICFEDIFPELARQFVNRGADFLAVITNDAWFGKSSAPYQHLQASIFRAIENGVSVVRAANTGVSAFITPLGEVAARVKNQEGKDTFIMGGITYPVTWDKIPTLYRQGGWLFPYLCAAVFIAGIGGKIRR